MNAETNTEVAENIAQEVAAVVRDIVAQVEKASGVWYIELKEGEPSGFDMGWTVEVVHALIRAPPNGRSCIVKFHQAELSQLIDSGIVQQKAPRELLIFLHKKIGARL